VLLPSELPVPSPNFTNPALDTPGRTDLDALIAKVRCSLREDFLHLPATDDTPADDVTSFQRLNTTALDLPPVNMDKLERKIQCRSVELDDSTPAPTSCRDPTPYCHPLDIHHCLQPELHPVVCPGTTTTAPMVHLPAKPPDPNATQQSVHKDLTKPSNHCKHQTTPHGSSAPLPKCAHITSYLRLNPGNSVSTSPSLPLPPFNPVLMCTPDKYTQHNFRPP